MSDVGDDESGTGDAGARATIQHYYAALRRGDPLAPYFANEAVTVKFGVSEALFGGEAVAAGLAEQTRTTRDWTVESRRLSVAADGDHAWFADVVDLAWTDDRTGDRRSFETRWSGSLRRGPDGWQFLGMHVSASHDLDTGAVRGIELSDGEPEPESGSEPDGDAPDDADGTGDR